MPPSIPETKNVFTNTFTCTAEVPMIAGPISDITRLTPGSVKLTIGKNRNPTLRSDGTCIRNCAAPPISVPIAIPMMAHWAGISGTAFGSRGTVQLPPLSQ